MSYGGQGVVSREGFSVVAVGCGGGRKLEGAVRDIINRSFESFRCVVVSKKSASKDVRIVGRCTNGISC